MEQQSVLEIRQQEFASRFNLTLDEYLTIVRSCTMDQVIVVLELMRAKHHKTSFRKHAAQQIRRWLANRMIGTPLTQSQFQALKPTWPITWELPR